MRLVRSLAAFRDRRDGVQLEGVNRTYLQLLVEQLAEATSELLGRLTVVIYKCTNMN